MRNKYLLQFILCTLIQLSTFGQIKYSLKAGLSVSEMKTQTNAGNSSQYIHGFRKPVTGITLGIQVQTNIWKNFDILGELSYTKKGTLKLINTDNNGYIRSGTSLTLNYIELPVLIKYRISKSFEFGIGPTASYLLKATFKEYYYSPKNTTKVYKKLDLGISGDLFYRANKKVAIGLRYTYGLNKTNLKSELNPNDPEINTLIYYYPSGRNKNFQAYIIYTF